MTEENALRRLTPSDTLKDALNRLTTPAVNLVEIKDLLNGITQAFSKQIQAHEFKTPEEPNDSELVSRILSPEKFIRFLGKPGFHFSQPKNFRDRYEGTYPSDVILEHVCGAEAWVRENYRDTQNFDTLMHACTQIQKAKFSYPIGTCSCWTLIDGYRNFSEILWQHHAGGQNGVALVTTYGELRKHFQIGTHDPDLICGKVDYSANDTRYHPAFRKRPTFEHEQEIRFFSPMNEEPFQTEFYHQNTLRLEIGFSDDVDDSFESQVIKLVNNSHPASRP